MPHQVATFKLSRPTGPRQALFKGLVRSLILHERIQTTLVKARATKPNAERLITMGRKALAALEQGGTPENKAQALHYRRLAFAFLQDDEVLTKVFEELAKRYKDRPGGYTRILKLGQRKGDGASVALLELV